MALAGEKRDIMTKSALEADVRLVRIEDGRLEVALERQAARTLVNDLSRKLEQWTGRRWTVIVSNEDGQPTLRSQNEQAKNEQASDKQNQAIEKLEAAKKELERLLRQLREEEIERVLAQLQQRCEKMLAMQQMVLAGTVNVVILLLAAAIRSLR